MQVSIQGNTLSYLNEESKLRYVEMDRRTIFSGVEGGMTKEGILDTSGIFDSGISPRGREAVSHMQDIFSFGYGLQVGWSS